MKKTKFTALLTAIFLALALCVGVFAGCNDGKGGTGGGNGNSGISGTGGESASSDKDDEYSYQSDLTTNVTVTDGAGNILEAQSEAAGGYTKTVSDGYTTLTFGAISADTTYGISGTLNGNIVIDADESETYKFELEMNGLTIQSEKAAPIVALSGDKVKLTAKNGSENHIYDNRAEVTDDSQYSACVYSVVDLNLQGKGSLWIKSENNNGVHTKDDLEVKNLTLYVNCVDNALKGNDSVSILSGTLTLIARKGDGIKTSNSGLSSKNKQKGTIAIDLTGNAAIDIYAACDGIDAAYDVTIDQKDKNLTLDIHTDKYSAYSEEVTATASGTYYIRTTNRTYDFSVFYTSDGTDGTWKNAVYYTSTTAGGGFGRGPGGGTTYHYYKVDKVTSYTGFVLYAYTSSQSQGQADNYAAKSSVQTVNNNYDTMAVTVAGGTLSGSWTNYTTQSGGGMTPGPGGGMMPGGGMNDGNADKGDYSTKGIKADNEIVIASGTINITSYDDSIHANNDVALENEVAPLGNVTVTGGTLTLYSNDDGIHADNLLTVSGGTVKVTGSYEGLEGAKIVISGGNISVVASDDGINGTGTSGVDLEISGGNIYVFAGGDGLDTNSKTSYQGIVFSGGTTVVISTSSNNSCIDTEAGYTYGGGKVFAMCPNGMTGEVKQVKDTSGNGYKTTTLSLTKDNYAVVSGIVTVKLPVSINNGFAIYLGSGSASISTSSGTSLTLDDNGVCWN